MNQFKFLSLLIAAFFYNNLCAQNVGIGTNLPVARLHVTDSSVLFSAVGLPLAAPNDPPISGGGRRLMWYADKAAFRAGYISNTQWNKDSIGIYSVATGSNNIASGGASTAMGAGTWAYGRYSTALGLSTAAFADASTAMGIATLASQNYATAMGNSTTASGNSSTSMGISTIASGYASIAMGNFSTASGYVSTALGFRTKASGDFSYSLGFQTIAKSYSSLAVGRYNDTLPFETGTNWVDEDRLFVIGNGVSNNDRRNALAIYKNGNTDINGYVRIGKESESAPRIKTKKITATGPAINGITNIVHDVNQNKILSVSMFLDYCCGRVGPSFTEVSGYEYNFRLANGNIEIYSKNGNSDFIGDKNVTIFITYEE